VSAPALIPVDQLIENVGALCAQPSPSGQEHELRQAADLVAQLMWRSGLDARVLATPGAPVVFGWRAGRQPYTLLLYHHYDVAPAGLWRAWHHEPYALAERDEALYARGVALGKGPLAAHLSALAALLAGGELPCGVAMIAEGEALIGSPHLPGAIEAGGELLRADACLASAGERDALGTPYCYSGSKGLLRLQLAAFGSAQALAPGLAAIAPNPLWRLVWALGSIKGDDEDVRVVGFYDSVEGPSREQNQVLRRLRLDEQGRLAAWQLPQFLFGMSGPALMSAEATLPTCNLSALSADAAATNGEIGSIPSQASATLDLQLVPAQRPAEIAALVEEHLASRGFGDISCKRLPGGYGPASAPDSLFVQQLAELGASVYGTPLTTLPMGPFALPLQLFRQALGVPVAALGCLRPNSGVRTANERAPLQDLLRHGQLLVELMQACGD
jgi:acetylornithine deacetylase/succinyl-diaminopimelate desuccinylase-like protein